ncbi:glycosyltransferase [Bosea thiooxidans]
MKTVSVIIPHYNDLKNLRNCLSALEGQSYDADLTEIIIVDNNSACPRSEIEDAIGGRASLIIETRQGAGPARNAGVAASTGEILAFIDSDCTPSPDWIGNGVKGLEASDFAGGRVDVTARDSSSLTPSEAFETVFAFDFKHYIEQKRFTGSGNMFVWRNVFLDVGGFRNALSEDMDWSHRAIEAGYRLVYVETAAVSHPARHSFKELQAKWRRVVSESFEYDASHGKGKLSWATKALVVAVSPFAHVLKIARSNKISGKYKIGAVIVLFGIRFYRSKEMIAKLI